MTLGGHASLCRDLINPSFVLSEGGQSEAKRAHVLDYDTFTPSIATTRKLGFSVSSSCAFNS